MIANRSIEFALNFRGKEKNMVQYSELDSFLQDGDYDGYLVDASSEDANQKYINQLSEELKKVSDDCRNLKIDKKEFFGGSMTITSLGGIGGFFFTPIINFPEVAILGVGRSYKKQIFREGKFVPRTMLPLSLSYDHRIIDGAEAAKFNNELKDNLGSNFAYNLSR